MRQKLKQSIEDRLRAEIVPQNPLKYLKDVNVDDYLDSLISVIYLYTRIDRASKNKSLFFTEMISGIGHSVRQKLKLKRDSALAVKTGAFLLWSFEQLMIVRVVMGAGTSGHHTYIVQVLDDDSIADLWSTVSSNKVERLPAAVPYADWTGFRHPTEAHMVKTGSKEVAKFLTPSTHPILFECLNRAQHVGWRINKEIYDVQGWALRNKAMAFSDIWDQPSHEAKATKLREAKAIGEIAGRYLEGTFYHLYYYDFRGRKYPTTAYLHEQGSDLARGMLLREDKKAIGKDGFFWLLVSIASNWAGSANRDDGRKTDKIPLQARYDWAVDNEEILLSYAENPKVNQGWMEADKPWQFLAACYELMHLRIWQTERNDYQDYSYESSLECFIDGSNNGSQHLAALTRDEETAPHVNLVPSDLPGDLYKYIADHVWGQLDAVVEAYTRSELAAANAYIDTLIEYKKAINSSEPRSEQRKALVEEIKDFKLANEKTADKAAPVYWLRITDQKQRRKIVKRNVMTLPYGGTPYGLGQQQIDDAPKHGIDALLHMEYKWGAYMGRAVFDSCKAALQRPMQLLNVFEDAGRRAEAVGEFLQWTVPITDFMVIQHYTEGRVKKTWVQYGPPRGPKLSTGYYENTYQLMVCFTEDQIPSKGRQISGASPNAIHSLDAAHLALTVYRCNFVVTTIHDSFGCLLADMPQLFRTVRECFLELYYEDPLGAIMQDMQGDITSVQFGTLDLSLVLESEYCFV